MRIQTRETAFNKKVEDRLRSSEWNMQIARNVLQRRSRRKYIIAAAGSAASLAMAASLIFAILPGFRGETTEGAELNQFVNAQIEGTWKKVFSGNGIPDDNETILGQSQDYTSTDTLIDETLAQRL